MSTIIPLPGTRRRRRSELLWREAVGDVLREARQDRGERILDTASAAGVSPQYLSEVERGLKDPSSEMLSAITGALELPVHEVAGRAADRMARGSGPLCLAA